MACRRSVPVSTSVTDIQAQLAFRPQPGKGFTVANSQQRCSSSSCDLATGQIDAAALSWPRPQGCRIDRAKSTPLGIVEKSL